jgi:hypothetical protein
MPLTWGSKKVTGGQESKGRDERREMRRHLGLEVTRGGSQELKEMRRQRVGGVCR